MELPSDGVAHFFGGLPGFEIDCGLDAPLRPWLMSSTAIMGTLAAVAR